MAEISTIVFGGDTHGDIGQVRWLLGKAVAEKAQAVFVLGDFGIWNHVDGGAFTDSVSAASLNAGIPVYFLPGNHENYDLLEEWEEENDRDADGFVVVAPGVLYSPRAHRWTWSGVRFLSLGGAYSVDKAGRVYGDRIGMQAAQAVKAAGQWLPKRYEYLLRHDGRWSWWPQEEISDAERDAAMAGGPVDVMLTHDKPLASRPDWNRKDIAECRPNQMQIQKVVDAVRPKLLLHGHLHYAYTDTIESTGTLVQGLDCDPGSSSSSGGSGDRELSHAVLDLLDLRQAPPVG